MLFSPCRVISASATPDASTRWRMISMAWSTSSVVISPSPPSASVSSRGVRMSWTPPSRSSASPGAKDAPLSSPWTCWAMTIEPNRAATRTSRVTILRSGRGAVVANAVFSLLSTRSGATVVVLVGGAVHRLGVDRVALVVGGRGQRVGVVRHGQPGDLVRVLLVLLDGEGRLSDGGDGLTLPHGLDAGGGLEGDDLAVDVHDRAVEAGGGHDLVADLEVVAQLLGGLALLLRPPGHHPHHESEDGDQDDEFHGDTPQKAAERGWATHPPAANTGRV